MLGLAEVDVPPEQPSPKARRAVPRIDRRGNRVRNQPDGMGETPTLNDSLPPKCCQFSLEDVEDHYLEWLEKWIAEIESGPA